MGFHPPKNKPVVVGQKTIDDKNSSVVLNMFKTIAVEMKKRGAQDTALELFAKDPKPESLGLKPDPYRDAMFVQITERTTEEERFAALCELANQGKI